MHTYVCSHVPVFIGAQWLSTSATRWSTQIVGEWSGLHIVGGSYIAMNRKSVGWGGRGGVLTDSPRRHHSMTGLGGDRGGFADQEFFWPSRAFSAEQTGLSEQQSGTRVTFRPRHGLGNAPHYRICSTFPIARVRYAVERNTNTGFLLWKSNLLFWPRVIYVEAAIGQDLCFFDKRNTLCLEMLL